ncbi:S9 family peptidase [uncultured Microscilla sp.]|uniref:S9 family peptidase n=1 Tax=uncultured Microscilla sp. TaxID=432653 RepID=UPI0026218B45|nr:S9 family peptidase [uncultured Microscilla sp.]
MRKLYNISCWWIMVGLLLPMLDVQAQQKKVVTVEDVWQFKFFARGVRGVNWMKNGRYYTTRQGNKVVKFDIKTRKAVATLFEGKSLRFDAYGLSAREDKLLLATQTEAIYRRSSKSYYYVYDINTKKLDKLTNQPGKQLHASFSPDGSKVAFVRNNNMFVVDLATKKETQITNDGQWNHIINGNADWVYEEEFSFSKAFFWSPDSKRIAFYKFDESKVKEYNMQRWGGQKQPYAIDYRFKYPKAGEDNAVIQILVYNVTTAKSVKMDIGAEQDMYIPRLRWTQNPELLSIRRLNRLQNKLELLHANANTGKTQVILTEESKTYVDVDFTDDLTYLKNGKEFIHTSERDGYKHIYLYKLNGKLVRQITKGNWEVRSLAGIDEKRKLLYFTSTEVSPLERHLYRIDIKGRKKVRMTKAKGTHRINFSPDFKYYIDTYNAAAIPTRVSLHEAPSGKLLQVLEENKRLKKRLENYQISYKEFFNLKTSENVSLNGWMIKPHNFDKNKKYPVLMFVYGGPGSQQVTDSWDAYNFFWYQLLASKGYMVVCVDNRGTGGRGRAFKHVTYKQLGYYETIDQIEAAKYLAKQPYVDASRIGIWGWSYGGYMSSLCLMKGADVFKAAIAVAPVSTWRFYDTIYTERFLQRPQDNAKGYDKNSPLNHVNKLKGNYLLVHGTGDDNVHFQNAVELQNALIKAGKQFQSFYYPNRTHSIFSQGARPHLYTMMTNFLLKNL